MCGMTLFDQDAAKGWSQLVKSFRELDEYVTGKALKLLIEPAHRFDPFNPNRGRRVKDDGRVKFGTIRNLAGYRSCAS